MIQGQEYDPNKRIKRSAAKAAQKIIDQIKNLDESEDEPAEEEDKDRDFEESVDIKPIIDVQMVIVIDSNELSKQSIALHVYIYPYRIHSIPPRKLSEVQKFTAARRVT